ncbi:MAG: T9SS type A sorting domain-containing protein, partial [Bacteroidota bacterium]
GVYLDGAASTGTQITGNAITGADATGILVDQHDAVQITGNTITGTSNQGISIDNSSGALRVLKNTITGASGTGIRINGSDAAGGSEGLIANNAVQMNSGSGTALNLFNSDFQQVVHNTLRLGSGVTSGQVVSLSGTQNAITLRNNLLVNEMGSYAVNLFNTPTNFTSDWNNLRTSGANVGRIGSTDYADLAAFQAASGTDANSVSTDVTFASATDLHLSGASQTDVTLAAIPFSGITDDRDGDARLSPFTAMGADEATSLATSQAVSSDGMQDFGAATAVDVNFQNVSGSGTVAGLLLTNSPSNVSGISENNVSAYRWVFEADGTLSFGASTEIRFDLDELTNAGITDANDIVVYRRDTPGSGAFSALTTGYAAGTNEVVATGFTSFSEFVFASNTNALPVELTAFNATLNDGAVTLGWTTASETNNAGFEVQWARLDRDLPADWIVASFVEGQGTTLEAQRYTYNLADLEPGTYRFRLRQVDFDGTFAYSPEVELTLEMAEAFWLSPAYPNPFNPQAQFEVMVRRSQPVAVRVYDVAGRQVLQLQSGLLEAGTRHPFRIDASALASGTYLIRITGEDFAATQRVVLLK